MGINRDLLPCRRRSTTSSRQMNSASDKWFGNGCRRRLAVHENHRELFGRVGEERERERRERRIPSGRIMQNFARSSGVRGASLTFTFALCGFLRLHRLRRSIYKDVLSPSSQVVHKPTSTPFVSSSSSSTHARIKFHTNLLFRVTGDDAMRSDELDNGDAGGVVAGPHCVTVCCCRCTTSSLCGYHRNTRPVNGE